MPRLRAPPPICAGGGHRVRARRIRQQSAASSTPRRTALILTAPALVRLAYCAASGASRTPGKKMLMHRLALTLAKHTQPLVLGARNSAFAPRRRDAHCSCPLRQLQVWRRHVCVSIVSGPERWPHAQTRTALVLQDPRANDAVGVRRPGCEVSKPEIQFAPQVGRRKIGILAHLHDPIHFDAWLGVVLK